MADWSKILNRGRIEDRRSLAPAAIGGLSFTGVALLFLINVLTGGSTGDFLHQLESIPIEQQQNVNSAQFEGQDSYEVFTSAVLGSTNEMWSSLFSRMNQPYLEPKLVLFRVATESGCGYASSDVGPHYCPLDKTIYLDETFFEELTRRFGARGGDVAEAYVIAHEVGHHVQNELGIMEKVRDNRSNELSIKLELQADCFAGLWANSISDKGVFEPGEIHEAMDAAAAIGDDRIQKSVTGQVNPESWTHGSSQQRVEWFDTGFNAESLTTCDTF